MHDLIKKMALRAIFFADIFVRHSEHSFLFVILTLSLSKGKNPRILLFTIIKTKESSFRPKRNPFN